MNETSELIDTKAEFKSYATLHPFIWAGNSTVTLVSKKSGKRFTYLIKKADKIGQEDTYFVSILNGPDNVHSYGYIGMFNAQKVEFRTTKNSSAGLDAPSVVMFRWFMSVLSNNPEHLFKHAELWHEGKCGRCGRKLTVPSSIETGIGPDCLSKM